MVARINTVTFKGIDIEPVDVQVQIASGLPSFSIVGLADKAVAESRERVRAALHALGIAMPPKRVTVNLAPADVAKEGSHYDLPIALGLLAALDILPAVALTDYVVMGELSLDGGIRRVSGILPAAIHANTHGQGLICPHECGAEALWAGELDVLAPENLLQIINHMKGTQVLGKPETATTDQTDTAGFTDLAAVKGQDSAKRALEIAAAGGHNLLMSGPPGSGKSMLAGCLPGILPPLTSREALETSIIHSVAGTLPADGLVRRRPFRDPHHSASLPALVGGGHKANPGEISLAHNGILFLDEIAEFARNTLESLRQPMETGQTLIARANHHVTYPARFQLIAAMNPCKCGYLGDTTNKQRECNKAPRCGLDYQMKLSGPMLDRMDIRIDVPAVALSDLSRTETAPETSKIVAQRVQKARDIQFKRQKCLNAHLPAADIDENILISDDAKQYLVQSADKLGISARGYHRLLRVARTIADMDENKSHILKHHIAESLSYRNNPNY